MIHAAQAAGRKIGICGQAPSDYPEFARFLVTEGTWLQRESAEGAAESAPGIREVVNSIVVEPPAWSAPGAVDEIC